MAYSPESISLPVGVVNGNDSGGMKLRRRSSLGSIPISAANTSIIRSIASVASGRPAPRYAPMGAVLVVTELVLTDTLSMSYTPLATIRTNIGSSAPIIG